MIHKYCYFDGKIIPVNKARIVPNDLGVLRGYGAFDFSRTYNGKLFRPKDQYARFQNSTKKIGLKLPVSGKKFEEILYQLLKKNKVADASFRAVMTGGPSEDMISVKKPLLFILVEPAYAPTPIQYSKGVKLITHEYMRYAPEAKTTNYIEAVKLQKEKKKQGAFEILYTFNGNIFECASSNFFLFKGKTLVTAKNSVLPGITRKTVLTIAKPHFNIEEREVSFSEISEADEVFITGANKKILPIVKIGNIVIGSGKVGEQTKILQRLFDEYVSAW